MLDYKKNEKEIKEDNQQILNQIKKKKYYNIQDKKLIQC